MNERIRAERLGWALGLSFAVVSAGCGLTLDHEPPAPDGNVLGGIDAGMLRIDAATDAGGRDAGARPDANPPPLDASADAGSVTTLDGGAIVDATPVLDTGSDASASVLDAALADAGTDAGPPDAGRPDAGRDASSFACVGVHPIVGPPRTCNPGSCLCIGSDACFTADVVRFCCSGTYACASPPTDCLATHPIVGPPRTCPSGNCYCANPDACFPADRADRCCGVDVVCVP